MKRKIHNYTSNLEVTSLLIRIKNLRNKDSKFDSSTELNRRINKYVTWHTRISEKTYGQNPIANAKKRKLLDALKLKVIRLSEVTAADSYSYNKFGSIILLMIKKILTKPQFSGYSFKDAFYSDASYKILKYLGNFDHTLISKRSGEPVNAFAYLTQIIHNSIIFVIGVHKRDQENLQKQTRLTFLESLPAAKDVRNLYFANEFKEPPAEKAIKHLYYSTLDGSTIIEKIKSYVSTISGTFAFSKVYLHFMPNTTFSAFEYADLSEIINKSNNLLKIGNRIDSIVYDDKGNILIKDE